jgi:hypothetical protein
MTLQAARYSTRPALVKTCAFPCEHRVWMVPPSLLNMDVDGCVGCDLRWMHGLSLCSPEAMARRSVRRSVRRSQNEPSLRSQTTTEPCGSSSAGAGADRPHPVTILVCAFGEQRRQTALMPFPVWALGENTKHLAYPSIPPSSLLWAHRLLCSFQARLLCLPQR